MHLNEKCCLCVMIQNEIANINTVLNNIRKSIHYIVVDGGSSDQTVEKLLESDVEVLSNPFKGFADQRLFLQRVATDRYSGEVTHLFFLDADEYLSDNNIKELNNAVESGLGGLTFEFKFLYCERELKHAYRHPVVQRLFKIDGFNGFDQGAREYFSVSTSVKAQYPIVHDDKKSGTSQELIKIYSNAIREAEWECNQSGTNLIRVIWIQSPPIVRSVTYFLYRYFIKFGFLDGRSGLRYLTMNVLIYRLLVDYVSLSRKKRS